MEDELVEGVTDILGGWKIDEGSVKENIYCEGVRSSLSLDLECD